MTITSDYSRLDTADVFPRAEIVSRWIRRGLRAANALYEALWDAAPPPGSGTQTFVGHDHSGEGGGPLPRNSQYDADGYTEPLWQKTNFLPGDNPSAPLLGKFYCHPGVASSGLDTFQEIVICYKASGGEFDVWAAAGPRVRAKETSDPAYITIKRPITQDKDWFDLYLFIAPVDGQGSTNSAFYLYYVNIIETHRSSLLARTQSLRELSTGVAGANTVYSYFDTLADEFAAADESLSAYILKSLYSAINFTFEGVMDWAAPGISAQYIKGHDHVSTQYGGRNIGRGKIWSTSRTRLDGSSAHWITWAVSASGAWKYADETEARRRTQGGTDPDASDNPYFKAYCDEFTSVGDPPGTQPYMDGWVNVDCDSATATVLFRLYNQTTGTHSATATFTTSNFGSWVYLDTIPISPSAWNDFDLQLQCDEEETTVYVDGLVVSESYEYNATKTCYKSSSGSRILGSIRSGTQVVAT